MPTPTQKESGELLPRVRAALDGVKSVREKRMFGSVGFMVNEKLCLSVRESRIMCRIDPALQEGLVARTGCRPVTMKGREYRGWVLVDAMALPTEKDLRFWVGLALDYNATLKGSGKRR
jgi:TfoX/Sxy family transcriptional regulator of competence genes